MTFRDIELPMGPRRGRHDVLGLFRVRNFDALTQLDDLGRLLAELREQVGSPR